MDSLTYWIVKSFKGSNAFHATSINKTALGNSRRMPILLSFSDTEERGSTVILATPAQRFQDFRDFLQLHGVGGTAAHYQIVNRIFCIDLKHFVQTLGYNLLRPWDQTGSASQGITSGRRDITIACHCPQ